MKGPVPQDRHPDDPCRLAYDAWWKAITLQGDPLYRYNLVGEAFEAGWRAAMNETKEAEAFLRKIRSEEKQEERRAKDWAKSREGWGEP